MMSTSTRFVVVAIFVVAGVALLWKFPGQKAGPPAPAQEMAAAPETVEEPQELPLPEPPVPAPPPPPLPRVATAAAQTPTQATMPTAQPQLTPEQRIDELLLADDLSEADKARRLLEMLPGLPEALQEEAAQHMCNLMPDDAYGQLGPLLTNGVAPEPLLDVVMTDLLSRPNTLKLPMLLQMARNAEHPRRDESKSVLEIYLEHDFGSDWAAWERLMQVYLKENPE